MKKFFTVMALFLCALSATGQEFSMFNAADIDKDGWLWLNTDAKIQKYVGVVDEDNNMVKKDGPLIQMLYADIHPDYPACTVSADSVGYGTDGELHTEGAMRGAICLPASSGLMKFDGGAVIVRMPSCSSFNVCVSSNRQVGAELSVSTSENIDDFQRVVGFTGFFNALCSKGVQKVSGLEKKSHGTTGETFKSDVPKYAMIRNGTPEPLYIHGFKISTPKKEATGITTVAGDEPAETQVFTLGGVQVAQSAVDAASLQKGVYIVKKGKSVKKVVID